jgi:hypothetical protein
MNHKFCTREEFILFLACMDFNGDEGKAEAVVKEVENRLGECRFAIPDM